MTFRYLDKDGAISFWTNIKNYILSKIPTKTSELTNDSGFLTQHQSLANYVTTNTDQDIAGIKSHSKHISILGDYIGNEFSTNARTCLYLKSNRDTDGKSGLYVTKFRQNVAQGALTGSNLVSLTLDVLENSVRTNNCISIDFRYFENDVPTKIYVIPKASVTSYMGTANNPWASIYGTNIYGSFTGNLTGDVTGNASSATKLNTARQINGTDFDGTSDITTAKWGTSRKIEIWDGQGVYKGTTLDIDGSSDIQLNLPTSIIADNFYGNATSATQFSTDTTVALTGDATGTSAGSKKGWSVPVTLANSGVTAGTYGPSADVTGSNNATILVPEITVDAKGRVTAVTNRTYKSVNTDSDKKVYQYYKSDDDVYRLLFSNNSGNTATSNVGAVYSGLNNSFYVNPSTGSLYATKLYSGGAEVSVSGHTHTTSEITDFPTNVSAFTNDAGYLTSHQSLSNYVTTNTAQTISGNKTFSSNITINGTYLGTEASTNERTNIYLLANRDTDGQSGAYISRFRPNRTQGAMGTSDVSDITFDFLENSTRYTRCFTMGLKDWDSYGDPQTYFLTSPGDKGSLGTAGDLWNKVYARSYYLGTAPFGDIVTHNASEFLTSADLLPIGSYIQFAGSQAPDGFLVCNGGEISRTTYSALFAVIGTTYGSGDGSTTFNLPDLTDRFLQGSSTSGTVKDAGLPNITGSIRLGQTDIATYGASQAGAFGVGGGKIDAMGKHTKDTRGNTNPILFNASRSSSIYGNSTTVQPPALTCLICIKY